MSQAVPNPPPTSSVVFLRPITHPGIIIILMFAGCVRGGFSDQRSDAPADDLSTIQSDGSDSRPADLEADAPRPLRWSVPQPLPAATVGLIEPGLRASGLEVVARNKNVHHRTVRLALDQPFGAWSVSTIAAGIEDPSFFVAGGVERAMVALVSSGDSNRHLERCPAACDSLAACIPIPVLDVTGATIDGDIDGPSVAVLPGGEVLISHNLDTGTSKRVFLAQPLDLADLTKGLRSVEVPGIWNAVGDVDDPAISPDGLVMVLDAGSDLWIAERPDTTSSFSVPVPLDALNTSEQEASPCLAAWSGGYELFFSRSSGGVSRIYRSMGQR